MKIKMNFPKDNSHISNLAFARALLIRDTIQNLNVSYEEKETLRKEVLEYLKRS